jgi:hypothetical protein
MTMNGRRTLRRRIVRWRGVSLLRVALARIGRRASVEGRRRTMRSPWRRQWAGQTSRLRMRRGKG